VTLPIDPVLPALLMALATHRAVVLEAPPGAGKTTRVPLALLDAPWLAGQKIVMLEPRRLAARAAAHRLASNLGEQAGDRIGYRMRGDSRTGPRTRVEVVTEGILTRMLRDDLALDGIGLVIFDEFHERSLIADTGLALTIATMGALREDLRVLVMSATLDGDAVAQLLGDAPVIRSEGRAWPVTTRHLATRADIRLEAQIARVVRDAVAEEPGSLLVFLPGAGEIHRVEGYLHGTLPNDVTVHALHGSLSVAAQDAAIVPAPAGRRKVVLATSVAETSLTIEGVRVVIDSGLMRVPRFSPRTGLTRLETIRVSRASADQRRGRAGRTEPGVCIRCWSPADEAGLVPYTRPEILDADLATLALDLALAGVADPAELRWLDPPPAAAFAQARELLQLLGGLDQRGRITPHGAALANLGAQPRLAHMLLRAAEHGRPALELAATVAALIEERDPLRGAGAAPPVDIQLRIDAVQRDVEEVLLQGASVDRQVIQRVRDTRRQYLDRIQYVATVSDEIDAGMALAWAYPDRVAQQRGAPGRFLLRNGRGAMLWPSDALAHDSWIVAAAIDDSGRDGRVTLAARVDIDALLADDPDAVVTRDDVVWEDATGTVQARRRTTLGALVLREVILPDPDPAQLLAALVSGIARAGIAALPWSDAANSLRTRLAFVHHHDSSWPDVSDAALTAGLDHWLAPSLAGIRKLASIARVDLADALRRLLTWAQQRQVDELAPERIEVPTGSRIAVDYTDPTSPQLAVRLQEVFGMTTTPTVFGGRVPVTMQLLSPGYRPVQVTRDLASFWATGYFDVRKDLRGRYPKHHWPDDPLVAEPVRGARRRRPS
jgi:ATP-dependent helicase HrpB